ncbi:MAG: S8 family serine peptidase, partial [Streptosporangiales bacterium]
MKPALHTLIEAGRGGEEVAVIVRLEHASVTPPPGVRVVARFGPVLTVRCSRRAVTGLASAAGVRSLSAPRLYGPDVVVADESAPDLDVRPEDGRRPAGPAATGRGVVVGIVDWGLDLAHPAFLRRTSDSRANGRSRVLAFWNQVPGADPALPNRYGYGRIHDAAAIDAALASPDPYRALRYDPAQSDLDYGAHGTVTTCIAAGSDFDGGVPGVAPDADIAFVHLSTWGDEGLGGLGDSVALLEGLDFIRQVAGGRPLVVNLSMGTIEGPGDGSTHVEQAIDAMILERPGCAVVESCGNYFQNGTHTAGRLSAGQQVRLPVLVQAPHGAGRHEIDIWYPATDRMTVGVIAPDGRARVLSRPGQDRRLRAGGTDIARIIHRLADPDNGRNEAMIWLDPNAPPGTWTVVLTAVDVPDGSYHVFIGREALNPRAHTRFPGDIAVRTTTTGSICNGLHTVTVGAYDPHDDDRPVTDFSSSGPTAWVGLARPHLLAPGSHVLAARSRAKDAAPGETPLATRMSGTSMAAP